VNRREFIAGLGTTAWPVAAGAQQPSDRVLHVGILLPNSEGEPQAQTRNAAFREALNKLGWVDGRNLRIDYRWGQPVWSARGPMQHNSSIWRRM
jgi:putative tryptophan/tyrosine transport system substrate-binding protein